MKKIIIWVPLLFAVFFLAQCGEKKTETPAAPKDTAERENPPVVAADESDKSPPPPAKPPAPQPAAPIYVLPYKTPAPEAGEPPAADTPEFPDLPTPPDSSQSQSLPPGSLPNQVRWKADGSIMVKVPAGSFTMGGTRNENEKPPHRVSLDTYYIDRTEVTFQRYLTFCRETGHRPPVVFFTTRPFPAAALQYPVTHVNWDDAVSYCKWAGKRLPSEAEWEKACAGPQGREFPWGNGWSASACTNRTNSGDHTSPVGSKPACKSPCGAMDMGGNVWEWTEDWYKSYPGSEFGFDYTGEKKVARGGCYFYSIYLLRCAARQDLPPDDASETNGFRCVVTPDENFSEKITAP